MAGSDRAPQELAGMERLPFAFYMLTQLAYLFIHYPTTRRLPRALSFACLLALLFRCYTTYSLQSPGEDYVLGCSNGIVVLAAVHITFICPDFPNGFQRNSFKTKPGSTPSQLPFAQKLGWMAEFASNMRRVGVTRGTGGAIRRNSATAAVDVDTDKRDLVKSSARNRFVISRVILSVLCLAAFQFSLLYRLRSPSFNPVLHEDAHGDEMFIRAHSSLLRRFWEVLVWAAGTISEMSLLQATAAAISVGVGVSEPEDWPPMFGSPMHAYSVRRFWSKTWHQVLRVPLEQSGASLARDALKLDIGTAAFMIVRSTAAFFLSAILHTGGDYAVHGSFEKSGRTFQFFLLQPAAILMEEIAIQGARSVRSTSSTRIRVQIPELVWRGVGYLWVCLWFTWCTPFWLDAVTASGGNLRTKLILFKVLERLY